MNKIINFFLLALREILPGAIKDESVERGILSKIFKFNFIAII